MKMLLWKDYRLSRVCILGGIMFVTLPYLILLLPYLSRFLRMDLYPKFEDAWAASALISQLTMVFLAGNIIACERADRSAEFLTYQGTSRKMVIASKLMLCTMAFVLICVIAFVLSIRLLSKQDILGYQIVCAATGICFFGCCWLLSSLVSSPAFAIVLGFPTPIIILITLSITTFYLHWFRDNECGIWYVAIATAAGLISLAAGTWYFLKSRES